jgi:hypothetical protein
VEGSSSAARRPEPLAAAAFGCCSGTSALPLPQQHLSLQRRAWAAAAAAALGSSAVASSRMRLASPAWNTSHATRSYVSTLWVNALYHTSATQFCSTGCAQIPRTAVSMYWKGVTFPPHVPQNTTPASSQSHCRGGRISRDLASKIRPISELHACIHTRRQCTPHRLRIEHAQLITAGGAS